MDYGTYDNQDECEAIRNSIKRLLNIKPRSKKEIVSSINASKSRIEQQMMRKDMKKVMSKRYIEGVWYYGLKPQYRR